MKKNYEALKQRQDEETMVQSSPPVSGEDSKWERESQETTRELLKVKDRLIEVERNVSILKILVRTKFFRNNELLDIFIFY